MHAMCHQTLGDNNNIRMVSVAMPFSAGVSGIDRNSNINMASRTLRMDINAAKRGLIRDPSGCRERGPTGVRSCFAREVPEEIT